MKDWMQMPSAPSIPTIAQSFGYEAGPGGRLVMQVPKRVGYTGRGEDKVGPGSYNQFQSAQNNQKRAVDFGKSKGQRSLMSTLSAAKAVPGPGHYEIDVAAAPNSKSTPQSTTFRKGLHRINERQTTRKREPPAQLHTQGPGTYTVSSSISTRAKPEHLQFFGSTSVRFNANEYVYFIGLVLLLTK